MIHDISTINIIGSGRVAGKLIAAFLEMGLEICGIFSRNRSTGQALANSHNIEFFNSTETLPTVDLTVIAVNDDQIANVSDINKDETALVVHTSGSVPLNSLHFSGSKGVFYPLQTFTSSAKSNWKEIPICIEAESELDLKRLENLAKKLSDRVFIVNSEQRKSLHLAAVFANNFVNHLFTVSEEILRKSGIDRDIILPLILETATKVQKGPAINLQTGPAVRGDMKTIQNHRELLKDHPAFAEIYEVITENIIQLHNDKKL